MEEDTIILGDFNAYHNMWNCENTDRNGERLYTATYNKGYIVLNSDTKSRMNYYNQVASNIDLIFANNNFIGWLDYKQIKDTWGSDHHPIEILVNVEVVVYRKLTNRVSNKNTDWKKYVVVVEERVKNLLEARSYSEIKNRYDSFIDIIIKAAKIASGKKNICHNVFTSGHHMIRKRKKQPVRWWDEEYSEAVKDRREKLKLWKKSGKMEDFIEFKRVRAVSRKIINKKKKKDFHSFCNGINRYTDMSYVWNTMRVFKKVQKNIQWNNWQHKDRQLEIRKTIEELAPPWVVKDKKSYHYYES